MMYISDIKTMIMEKEVLMPAADPIGAAIYDYLINGEDQTLVLNS